MFQIVLCQHAYASSSCHERSLWSSWITEEVSSPLKVLQTIVEQYHALTYANSIRTVRHSSTMLPFHIQICHQLIRAMSLVPNFGLAVDV
jgi:hypothetical protein